MKKTLFIVTLAAALHSFAADSAHISVSLRDHGLSTVTRRAVVLTPLAPKQRSYGAHLFTYDPLARLTAADGTCVFSNILWGTYRLDIFGKQGVSYTLSLGTNHTGTVSAAALRTSPDTQPPNPATNYYTMAQVDALLALVGGGSGGVLTPTDIFGNEWAFDGIALTNTTKGDTNPAIQIHDETLLPGVSWPVHKHAGQFIVGDPWNNLLPDFPAFPFFGPYTHPFAVQLRGTNAFWVDYQGVVHGNGGGITDVAGLKSGYLNAPNTIPVFGSMYIGAGSPLAIDENYNALHYYTSFNNTPACEWVKYMNGYVSLWEIEASSYFQGHPVNLDAFAWKVPIKLDGSNRQLIFGATASEPANTNAPVVWVSVEVGGQSYRLPLYQ